MIKIENFCFSYRETAIFESVSTTLNNGDIVGLVGKNGTGKSTLLKILSTSLLPRNYKRGTILINQLDIKQDRHKIKQFVQYISGGERGLYYNLTGYENLELYCYLNKVKEDRKKKIIDALSFMGLEKFANIKVSKYSLGMKQRLHLCKMFLVEASILLLDEPTNGLDSEIVDMVEKAIKQKSENGTCIIFTSHRMEEIITLSTKVLLITSKKLEEFEAGSLSNLIGERAYFTEVTFFKEPELDFLENIKEFLECGSGKKITVNLPLNELTKILPQNIFPMIMSIRQIENFEWYYSKIKSAKSRRNV
ncbi:ATP-binding cassette domain-containing protein [Streptococcus suis]|uniref:ABC transporter, ATP-binding protein n=2 Tax=Streptococcus suis TaxID=1307 RepID=A0A1X9I1W1_STRSU|nr:ABC transporter ATP-binding protein [Streptococcus suis]AER15041.1 Nod factor export ATP-binding protein I [Streptococcus suis SS12]ANJ64229.1 ABC transporter, ATP-binding protein [Streptococcus suis]MBL1181848.1 ABC transporter ATP-binding protein [Streptococcus suis]MBL1188965.1 ABC transporter ATP-binding protein [Streptococcus suis]MBL1190965.1 ABC transporter ATP-binding protein [Streptococcus suis]